MALTVLMAGSVVHAAPVITSVNPNNPLNTAGGQAITVTGTGLDAPAAQVWAQISAGTHHACAITFGGQAYCWGRNDGGMLGNGTGTASGTPVPVSTAGTPLAGKVIQQIMAGDNHSCALTTDGQMACWGWNEFGQLGDGTNTDRDTPVSVNTAGTPLAGKTIRQVMVAGYYTCAVSTDGQAACWGWNQYGQLGDGTTTNRNIPVAISTAGTPLAGKAIRQISGGGYTCAITTDGQAACWGRNDIGQLGNDTTTDSTTPVLVSTAGTPLAGKAIQQITTGNDHTCAITTDGQAACWGHNDGGELGDGTTSDRTTPVAVSTAGTPLAGKTLQQITAGHYHTCARTTDGQAVCWGWNGSGQLGDGTTAYRIVPVPVSTAGTPLAGKTIQQISAGFEFTCAVSTDGQAACWGENGNGKLGDGTWNINHYTPVAVSPISAAVPVVLAGDVAATNVAVGGGGTTLTFNAPPHAAGTYDLVLNYGGGVSATRPNALTYGSATVYTVTTSAGAGGAISPSSAQVESGQTQTFTLIPAADYRTASVTGCGGAWAGGNTYTTGPVTIGCTVTATFTRQIAQTYTITASAGAGGTITPSGNISAPSGAPQRFTLTPNAGFRAAVGGTCGGTLAGNVYTTSVITADCTVVATFSAAQGYIVTASAIPNGTGTISPAGAVAVNPGAAQAFTITPAANRSLYYVTGTCGGIYRGSTYTTRAVNADCTVTAVFR